MPLKTTFTFFRAEKRVPMEIPVVLDGHRRTPGTESTFTENVSARGARVVSVRNWEKGEKLTLVSRNRRISLLGSSGLLPATAWRRLCGWRGVLETKGRWVV